MTKSMADKAKPKYQMQVSVRGQVFASVAECATALGVTRSHIYVTLCRGNDMDTIGLGKGHKPKGNPKYGGGRSKPIKIGSHVFPSTAAASRALGWADRRLTNMLRTNGDRQKAVLYAALLKLDAKMMKLPRAGDLIEAECNEQ